MSETITLINESRRAISFPTRVEPAEKAKLNDRGKPRQTGLVELERVSTYRPPLLEPGERVDVPRWYFNEIREIKSLAALLGKRDGLALGRSRSEAAQDNAREREAKLAEASAAQLAARDREIASLREELAAIKRAAKQRGERAAEGGAETGSDGKPKS